MNNEAAPSSFDLFENDPVCAERVSALRDRAHTLRTGAAEGGYSDVDLTEFWSIISTAPVVLLMQPEALSTLGGLGPTYFRSVVKESRSPKLHNYLKALSIVIEQAESRLSVSPQTSLIYTKQWISNPHLPNLERLIALETDLAGLIAQIRGSNSLSDIPELDDVWRKNIIALLETTLAVLKAPLIEVSLFKKARKVLLDLSIRTAADARTAIIGAVAGAVATKLIS